MSATRSNTLPTTKHGTLGWLAKLCFTESWEAVENALADRLPLEARRNYHIVRSGDAAEAVRLDLKPDDKSIGYRDFSPHPFWGAPYSILSVVVKPEEKEYLMYHGGEEILLPVEGAINYRFFWAQGGSPPAISNLTVRPGTAVRINPQIPHHAWATGKEPARAWMVMRHASDSASSLNSRKASRSTGHHPRITSTEELRNPTQYALIAWGLAEAIRIARDRAEIGIRELAEACGLEAARLSRLENVAPTANVSLDALWQIASYLRVPVLDLIANARWRDDTVPVPPPSGDVLFQDTANHPHRLHLRYRRFEPGAQFKPGPIQGDAVSWIVLKGRLTVELDTPAGSIPEIVDEGSVVHFRRFLPNQVESREPSDVLQITHAIVCECSGESRGPRSDAQP